MSTFYHDHQMTFDQYAIHTLNFATSQPTHRHYPKAKLIDMVDLLRGNNNGVFTVILCT